MRSIAMLVLLIFSLSFVYTGCKQGEEIVDKSEQVHEKSKKEYEATISDKVAPDVWDLIHTENYKLSWKMWPGKQNVYVNPIALEAIEKRESKFPIGSIIVMERYSNQDNLEKVMVAYRMGGDQETHGWFGADYSPDGQEFKVNESLMNMKP